MATGGRPASTAVKAVAVGALTGMVIGSLPGAAVRGAGCHLLTPLKDFRLELRGAVT
jgi:TctA family transporter